MIFDQFRRDSGAKQTNASPCSVPGFFS